jgi:hypothetical protein
MKLENAAFDAVADVRKLAMKKTGCVVSREKS